MSETTALKEFDYDKEKKRLQRENFICSIVLSIFVIGYFVGIAIAIGVLYPKYNDPEHPVCKWGLPIKNGTDCECYHKYSKLNEGIKCSHKKSSYVISALFQAEFLIFGGGYWYSENYTLGGCEIGAAVVAVVLGILLFSAPYRVDGEAQQALILIGMMIVCIIFWWIISLFLFGLNKYTDGKGIEMFRL